MTEPGVVYSVDLPQLAALVGCSSEQLHDHLVSSEPTLPSTFAELDTSSAPEVQVVPRRPTNSCALVVTAQHGYEHGYEADRASGAHKSLLPNELLLFEGKTLLYHCVEQLVEAGMERIVVVVHAGANGQEIVRGAREAVSNSPVDLEFVHLPKSTCHGASIIAARKYLPDQFLLVAADHVFSIALIRRLANAVLDSETHAIAGAWDPPWDPQHTAISEQGLVSPRVLAD